jgi:ABC-2 type transport system permease protein
MAGLSIPPQPKPGPISASQQFRAIAYLRWRLFANSFRRKGSTGELIARIIVYPIGFGFLVGPTIGSGFGAWAFVHSGRLNGLGVVFWAITILQIFVSINLAPPGLSFDPESLIRFPVTFSRYLIVRLFLGLLSASTILGTCCLLAAAVGTSIARPDLAAIAFASAILLAITNMLMIRMAFAWIDRWLSTRRARELFTGLIIFLSIGIQWANINFNPGFSSHHDHGAAQRQKLHSLMHGYHTSQAYLAHFPAGLATFSIVNVANDAVAYAIGNLFALTLFAAFFLAIFAWRMHVEYRGENLSDSAGTPNLENRAAQPRAARPSSAAAIQSVTDLSQSRPSHGLPPVIAACFMKEWLYVRRNTTQFFALLVPLAMIFLVAGKLASNPMLQGWTFPAGVVYSTLAIAALAYNSLGLDASGVQFYFIAPIQFRSVMVAKNLFSFALVFLEAVIIYCVLCYVSVRPPLLMTISTMLWLVFAVLANVTLGNIRSIVAPKKMDPSKLSRKQTSQLSALMSVVLVLVLGAIGGGVLELGEYLDRPWLPIPIFTVLALAALALYMAGLSRLDALVLNNRENLIEELSKAS